MLRAGIPANATWTHPLKKVIILGRKFKLMITGMNAMQKQKFEIVIIMGSLKNKGSKKNNCHRDVYVKRRLPTKVTKARSYTYQDDKPGKACNVSPTRSYSL